jgi:hypothetical protein
MQSTTRWCLTEGSMPVEDLNLRPPGPEPVTHAECYSAWCVYQAFQQVGRAANH